MEINHNQVVYIPKGEHDNPHGFPQQQQLEASTEIGHMAYSHIDDIAPEPNSFQKLDYIYQHFQDNEKIYEYAPTHLSMRIVTLYTHKLTTILNIAYLKILLVVII